MFNREIEAAEAWMGAREAFLASEDVGGSLDGVEALIKKHEDFDKSLNAQVTSLLCVNLTLVVGFLRSHVFHYFML